MTNGAVMNLADYLAHDALGLAALVARREVSAAELLERALMQITELDPSLNAVVAVHADHARRQVAAGLPEGPFHGVPFLVKDALPIAGLRVTFGSVALRHHVARETHEIARRFERAGLVICGSTNLSELGLLPTTEPRLFGPTRNPWDPSRSPGGSSGGSAVAVAAGMVPMAHAQDGGGSIRIPASACGVFGLKPSRGRVPENAASDPMGYIVDHVLTRSVRDSAAMLDVLSAAHPESHTELAPPELPFLEHARRDPAPLRIAFTIRSYSGRAVAPECAAAVLEVARRCGELGHHVEERAPVIDGERYYRAFAVLWAMAAGYFFRAIPDELARAGVPRLVTRVLERPAALGLVLRLSSLGTGKRPFEPFTGRLAARDAARTPGDLWVAWKVLREAGRVVRRFLGEHDLLLTPVLGAPPWPIGKVDQRWSDARLERELFDYVAFTPIANTEGLPAMSVPLVRTDAGLPIGVQFLGGWGQDAKLLALAGQLERVCRFTPTLPRNHAESLNRSRSAQ